MNVYRCVCTDITGETHRAEGVRESTAATSDREPTHDPVLGRGVPHAAVSARGDEAVGVLKGPYCDSLTAVLWDPVSLSLEGDYLNLSMMFLFGVHQ